MLKIYLSGPKHLREKAKECRAQLQADGHEVLGDWIDSTDELALDEDDDAPVAAKPPEEPSDDGGLDQRMNFKGFTDAKDVSFMASRKDLFRADRARRILQGILKSDGLVVLTDKKNHTRESSYGEYAIALGAGKTVWLVGHRFHDLHFYEDILHFRTFEEFRAMLKQTEQSQQQKGEREA